MFFYGFFGGGGGGGGGVEGGAGGWAQADNEAIGVIRPCSVARAPPRPALPRLRHLALLHFSDHRRHHHRNMICDPGVGWGGVASGLWCGKRNLTTA